MPSTHTTLAHTNIYLEIGTKKIFAGAMDWPGWCRSGKDEATALQALLDNAPRYAQVLKSTRLGFKAPKDISAFKVVERLKGNMTTDFGAPDASPASDTDPVDATELKRFQTILKAAWAALDDAAKSALHKELRKGPRGGGRELNQIIQHAVQSEVSYHVSLGGKLEKAERDDPVGHLHQVRQTILDTLAASARGEVPTQGPRGGLRWTARYFMRRATWHILDHAWEIEDRILA
jgi:hypothetical protein